MAYAISDIVRDSRGVPVSDALVYVYSPQGGLASLYNDLGAPIENPLATNDNGLFEGYATEDGFHKLSIHYGGRERYVEEVLLGTEPIAKADGIATALVTYTFGYIGVDDPLPPEGVGIGEGYVYTQDARVYGAVNDGGTGDVKFEILTAASIGSLNGGTFGYSGASAYPDGTIGAHLGAFVVASDAPWSVRGDNSTDNGAAINAAMAHCADLGGGDVLLPGGLIRHSIPIDNTYPNVRLVGRGGDISHGAGSPYTGKTTLVWTGAAGGTMVRVRTPYGPATQRRYGQGMIAIELDGRSVAGYGLEVNSITSGEFDRIHIRHCTIAQYYLPCGVTGTDGPAGEALDTQNCKFTACTFDARAYPSYTATNAKGWEMAGSTNANVSGNVFEMLNGIYSNGPAYSLTRADNNVFIRSSAFRAAGADANIFTWDLAGSNSATGTGAYGNTFIQIGWDAAYGFRFTASQAGDGINTRVNTILGYDEANGGQFPTFGANSRLIVHSSKGVMEGVARIGISQLGAGPNDGVSMEESGNRHDLYVSGGNLIYGGNGFTGTFRVGGNVNVISSVGSYQVDAVKVIGPRRTGWAGPTGTATRTTYDTTTVTLPQLAERVKALVDDLTTHGLLGA